MQLPNDFYTPSTLFTLSGCSLVVWLITSVLVDIFGSKMKKTKKLFALFLSLVLALLGASLTSNPDLLTWVIAVINGFLIYASAVGINTITNKNVRRSSVNPTSNNHSSFFESWW